MRIAQKLLPYIADGSHILDFGSGNMWLSEELLKKNESITISAIDVIEDQNFDKSLLGKRLSFLKYDTKEIPFPDNHFDIAIASSVMHHTPDPEYYLTELKRVVKPGGHILLVEEMYHNLFDKFIISAQDLLLNKLKKGVPVPLHFRPYKHYLNEFRKNNLKIEEESYIRPSFPYVHHYVFKLGVLK